MTKCKCNTVRSLRANWEEQQRAMLCKHRIFKGDVMTPQKSSRFYGVMVSTLDSESSDPSSNLGRTKDFELSEICAQCSTPPSNLHRQVLSLVHGFGQKRLQNVNV